VVQQRLLEEITDDDKEVDKTALNQW